MDDFELLEYLLDIHCRNTDPSTFLAPRVLSFPAFPTS
jgi:hypothetical protein